MNVLSQSIWIPNPTLTEKNLDDQRGRVVIVTGGYAGIGYELSRILYERNATVYLTGRSPGKASKAIAALREQVPSSQGRLEFLLLDLADLTTTRSAAVEFMARESRLDVLVNNAGVADVSPEMRTQQGLEMTVGTDCVGPYLFTKSLLPILRQTARLTPPGSVRVTWAGSIALEVYSPPDGVAFDSDGAAIIHADRWANYGQAKAGNLFLGVELAKRCREDGIVSVTWNPGNLWTDMVKNLSIVRRVFAYFLAYPPIKGAYTELYAGWSNDITPADSGCYVVPWGRIGQVSRADVAAAMRGKDEGGTGGAERFWDWCEAEAAGVM